MKRLLLLVVMLSLIFALSACNGVTYPEGTITYEIYSGSDTWNEESDGSGGAFLIAAWFRYSSYTEYQIDLRLVRDDDGIQRIVLEEDVAMTVIVYIIEEGDVPYIEFDTRECGEKCNDYRCYTMFEYDWYKYTVQDIRIYLPESAYVANQVKLDE